MSSAISPPQSAALVVVTVAVWAVLLLAALAGPWLLSVADPGDAVTRWTVRAALLWYAAAAILMLRLGPTDWRAATRRGRLARCCWTLGWAAYLVHVCVAFHFAHGWSHARAFQHVQDVSGFGHGIWFSYLFSLLWTLDVGWWWLAPASYATRPHRLGWLFHAYMAGMIFFATVVYESGLIRWAGVLLFVVLGFCLLYRVRPRPWRRDEPGVASQTGSAIPHGW
jgi:hypothetical protein